MAAREALADEGVARRGGFAAVLGAVRAQDEAYRAEVLGGAPRIGIEAACGFGWERWLGDGRASSSA